MVQLKIKLQKAAYYPGDEVEGWLELKHKGFKPTVVDKLVLKVEAQEYECVQVMSTSQTTAKRTLIECKQVVLDQQVSFGPGTYYFPFTFTLDPKMPYAGQYGRPDRKYIVNYILKGFALKIKEGNDMQTIAATEDTVDVIQKFKESLKSSATEQVELALMDKSVSVGKLVCILRCGQQWAEPESPMDVFLEVENISDLTIKLYIAVASICTVYGSNVTKEEIIHQFHNPILLGKVEPNDTTQFRRNLLIPTELATSPSTNNTELFQQKYQVQLVCQPSVYGIKTDGTLSIPIEVSTQQKLAVDIIQRLPPNVQQVFRPVIIDLKNQQQMADFSEKARDNKMGDKLVRVVSRLRSSKGSRTSFGNISEIAPSNAPLMTQGSGGVPYGGQYPEHQLPHMMPAPPQQQVQGMNFNQLPPPGTTYAPMPQVMNPQMPQVIQTVPAGATYMVQSVPQQFQPAAQQYQPAAQQYQPAAQQYQPMPQYQMPQQQFQQPQQQFQQPQQQQAHAMPQAQMMHASSPTAMPAPIQVVQHQSSGEMVYTTNDHMNTVNGSSHQPMAVSPVAAMSPAYPTYPHPQ